MCISHRLQCKIKSKINQVHIKIMKIPTVDNFNLINSSKWYHVYKHTNIHLLGMKYDHYVSNTLMPTFVLLSENNSSSTYEYYSGISVSSVSSLLPDHFLTPPWNTLNQLPDVSLRKSLERMIMANAFPYSFPSECNSLSENMSCFFLLFIWYQ
jgi:hypothetical protein